jgi:tetratricopeptide (TPR) repeat protein
MNAGNLDAAIALLWDAVNDMPGNREAAQALGAAQNRKGLECASAGSWAEATDYFGYALEQCPGDQGILQNLRNAALNRGRLQEARAANFAAEAIDKDWASLGQELSGAGIVRFPAAAPELMGVAGMGKAASEDAEEAELQAAKGGSQLPAYEPASVEAGQIFDTRGFWSGEIQPIKLHGLAPPPGIDYTAGPFGEDTVIQSTLKDQHEALAQKAKAQIELAELHAATAAMAARHEDPARLDEKEAELRRTIAAADAAAARKGEALRKRARYIHYHVEGFSEEPPTDKPEASP